MNSSWRITNKSRHPETTLPTAAPKAPLVAGPDGLGTEDHLSHLPDDCVLEVLNHLSRIDHYNMMTVSKRISTLCFHPSLKKWPGNELCIYQTKFGYGFELVMPVKERFHANKFGNRLPPAYQYHVTRSASGPFAGKRNTKQPDHFYQEQHTEPPHSWPIPDQFFDAVAEILQKHEASALPFDATIIDKLNNLLIGHKTTKIVCFDMSWPQDTTEEEGKRIRKSFARFVQNVRVIDMQDTPPNPIVNEEFLREIGDSMQGRELICNNGSEIRMASHVHANLFYPDVSIIEHIAHFNRLDAVTMTLNVNWVVRLIMMNMDAIPARDNRASNIWRFSVDQPITSDMISRQIRSPAFEYSFEHNVYNDTVTHRITRNENGKTARLYNSQYRSAAGHMHVISVNFLQI